MQTVITYLVFILGTMIMNAQNTIEVTMTSFKNDKGTVQVGLYNDKGQFLDKTFLSKESTISKQQAQVVFEDVPDGIYAISCYHDADNDGKLDMFMNMIPSESYGTSNNARGFFGPPKWEDAKFEVENGEVKKLAIRL